MGLVQNKVAIVTGSGANIGEASARKLAAEGARVMLADINLAGAERVASEIRAGGGEALAHFVDLGDDATIAPLMAATIGAFGRIDVLHNNAGGVVWLASDLAAFVTGQIISIDGGICHHTPALCQYD